MTTPKTAKSTATPAVGAVKQIEDIAAIHRETVETVVKTGADVAGKGVETAVVLTKDTVEMASKPGSELFKGYEDVMQFGKDNLEALVTSGTIVTLGVQDLSKTVIALAQQSLAESMATSKALAGAKTLKEIVDLSSSLAKSTFDKLVAESSKLSLLSTKLAEDALAPINSRMDAAVQKMTNA